MRRSLLFIICWLGVTAAFGQYTSRLGRFTVNEVKGCAPLSITITDVAGKCTGTCIMSFGDGGTPSTNKFTYTYNTPGTFKLSILYQSELAEPNDDISITVVENIQPAFNIYSCENNKVTVKVTDKSFDTYVIDFDGDGNPNTTIPMGNNATAQFDYAAAAPPFPAPHAYNISVRGKNVNSADNCQNRTESYTTLATGTKLPTPAISSLTAVDANTLALEMVPSGHIQYKLEINVNSTGAFQVIMPDLYQTDSVGIGSLLVDEKYYCFRVSAYDPCAGTNQYSVVDVCSQNFDVDYQNGTNLLQWQTSTGGVANWSINRNATTGYVSNLAGGSTSYPDKDYECKKEFCYQIVAHYGGGATTATSTSLIKCGIGRLETTFPPIQNVNSIVRAGAELSWDLDPALKIETFDIFKSIPGSPLTPLVQVKDKKYTDVTYDYAGGSCYQVNYGDNCGNRSTPGIVACPMALKGTIDERNSITLNWNSYKGYHLGIKEYQVKKYTKNLILLGNYPTSDTTFIDYDPADDNQVVIYSIDAIPNEPLGVDKKSVSNNLTMEKPVRLILPTAFTPNGDGINPTFTIGGKFVSRMSLSIFDRWGVLVFTSDKNEPWDGRKDGKPMPESAYVWKAEIEDFAGNTFTQQGTVLLLRPAH